MKYVAIHDKVLTKELPKEEDKILAYEPEGSPDKVIRAEVVSAGNKVKGITKGLVVHFLKLHSRPLILNGEEHLVVEEDKIMVAELNARQT